MRERRSHRKSPPHGDKPGPEWSEEDIWEVWQWCIKKENRKYLLRNLDIYSERITCVGETYEDVWSNFCMRLKQEIRSFDPRKGNLRNFLLKACSRSNKKAMREKARRKAFIEIDREDGRSRTESTHFKEEKRTDPGFLREFFAREILNTLNERDANIFYLRYWCGCKFSEIAAHLKLTEEHVRVLHLRTLRSLKKKLTVQHPPPQDGGSHPTNCSKTGNLL